MAKRPDVDVPFMVTVKKELVDRVGHAYRADYEKLVQRGKILVFDRGGEFVHLFEPEGKLASLRKTSVNISDDDPTPHMPTA